MANIEAKPPPTVQPVQNPDSSPAAVYIGGLTAAGKSEVALCLAELIQGEIISVDSMQVYCGLDIGTAKPSRSERQHVPHHLIDILPVSQQFDAAQFVRLASAAVQQIRARGKVPVFCGGTGLYFKAFLQGLGEIPPPNFLIRKQLEATPLANLVEELRHTDPATYARIDRHNPRRIIRALEVIRQTGRPFATTRAPWQKPLLVPLFFGLIRSPEELRNRINLRVDQMLSHGLIDETKTLLAQGLAENPTAMQAIGYRQAVEYLAGARSLSDTGELIKVKTRQFAKRQMTWFRQQFQMVWLSLSPDDQGEQTAHKLAEAWKFHSSA